MKRIRVIARLDINNDYVVKGKYLEGLRKVGTPKNLSEKYYENSVDEIVYIDAVASLYDRNALSEIIKEACKSVFIPITVGGGIRTVEDIQVLLNAGADKVAINSIATRNPLFIRSAVELFGSQAIVGSVVARRNRNRWEVFRDNAKHRTHIDAIEWAEKLESQGVGELMVTSIDKDGLMRGFDIELVQRISERVSIPVIACSGAGDEKDVLNICNEADCDAVALGSMLHYNVRSIDEIKSYLSKNGIEVR